VPAATAAPRRARRVVARAAVVLAACALAVGVPAGGASAHVHVTGDDATQGGYGVLTFRVPTESDTASTVALTVTFPAGTPLTSVSTQPVPGWHATVTRRSLDAPVATDDGPVTSYVAAVEWRADTPADGIRPGEFQQFAVAAGPLPRVASLTLPAVQTYSDGTTVAWNETATAGAEAAHPAPVLPLAAAASAPEGDGTAAAADPAPLGAGAGGAGEPAATSAAWPGVVGLVAGLLGLAAGGVALARTRRGFAGPP